MRFLGTGLLALTMICGCGTTRWTDTSRTATEQLLISDAMDRAVSQLDFRALAGRTVFLDTVHIKGVTDSAYLTSTLRQHMLATGCIVRDTKEEADYVAEVRVGAVGTDRNEMMFGVPSVSLPVPVAAAGVPASIPEMQLAKNTKQRAVVKMAVFAYNAKTGRPVWQSGIRPVESSAKDVWIAGAGPFQSGSIYEKPSFGGDKIDIPLVDFGSRDNQPALAVADDAYFVDEPLLAEERPEETSVAEAQSNSPAEGSEKPENLAVDPNIVPASHVAPPAGGATVEPAAPAHTAPIAEAAESAVPGANPEQAEGSAVKLRFPEKKDTDSSSGGASESPPLPPGDTSRTGLPPSLLDLTNVNPLPLRMPKTMEHEPTAPEASYPLGLPPLPKTAGARGSRQPASLTPAPPRP